ncbi:MAG: DUF3187 family protein [Steroidobacteraceae bacterium]|nr:DUF3187 family protein [Steroidobacteraceae bacterium]
MKLHQSLVVATAVAALAPVAQADPFLVRNQNPLLTPFGVPNPVPARLVQVGGSRLSANLHWGSASYGEEDSDDSFVVDAEMLELRLRYERAVGPRLALLAELPWRRTWEGVLDHFIDEFHDLTGLPGEARDESPRDRLLIASVSGGEAIYLFDQSGSGIGDIPLGLGYQIIASDSRALAAWLTVKAPAGDAGKLTGSGAADLALSLAGEQALSSHVRIFGQFDVTFLGEGDLLPALQEDLVWSGMAGFSWNAWRALDLTAQLAGNSRVFDAAGALAGDALVLVFGGSWRTGGGWRLDVSISEDVDVNASPDVVFNFGFVRALR